MSDRRNHPCMATIHADWDYRLAQWRETQAADAARERRNRVLFWIAVLYAAVCLGIIGWAVGLMLRDQLDGFLSHVSAITHLVGG